MRRVDKWKRGDVRQRAISVCQTSVSATGCGDASANASCEANLQTPSGGRALATDTWAGLGKWGTSGECERAADQCGTNWRTPVRWSPTRGCETALAKAKGADRRPAGGDAESARRAQTDPKSYGGANRGALGEFRGHKPLSLLRNMSTSS